MVILFAGILFSPLLFLHPINIRLPNTIKLLNVNKKWFPVSHLCVLCSNEYTVIQRHCEDTAIRRCFRLTWTVSLSDIKAKARCATTGRQYVMP